MYSHVVATEFRFQGNTQFHLVLDSLRGEGHVFPRVVVILKTQGVKEGTHLVIEALTADLWLGAELLGTGMMRESRAHAYDYGRTLEVVIPLSRAVLQYVDDQARSPDLPLRMDLRTAVRWREELRNMAVGQWEEDDLAAQATINYARTEWLAKVAAPTGGEEIVFLEVPIPAPPERERWRQALSHLAEAESFYRQGNDPEVLQRCYAAFEALEGAPLDIFALEPDTTKRAQLNAALRTTKEYMHSGRHVTGSGETLGTYAVDHRDAAFALGQAKVWLGYVSRLMQGRRRP